MEVIKPQMQQPLGQSPQFSSDNKETNELSFLHEQ